MELLIVVRLYWIFDTDIIWDSKKSVYRVNINIHIDIN